MNDRRWICSTSEEYWNCSKDFATRDAAIAHAITALAIEHDLEEGRRVYTGEIRLLTEDRLFEKLDVQRVLFALDDLLRGCLGPDFDYEVTASEAQQRDLVERLIATTRKWFSKHEIPAKGWVVRHVRSHVWVTQNGMRIPKDQ